jgi:uncharacterized membrane protein YozB (DUF420 family)
MEKILIYLVAQRPGVDGFLGTRASLMLDVVLVAMLVVVPVMALSIWLVRFRRRFQLHKTIQIATAVVLFVVVAAFELEMRTSGWVERAAGSPYWVDGKWNDWIDYSLTVHLLFAIPTPLLWAVVIVQAVRRFPRPPAPNAYSARHVRLARLAAVSMLMTAVTGWLFYWLAFTAT